MKPFAVQLRARREALNISQSELARLIGSDPSHVAHYEAGRREPTLANVRALAKALSVSIDYLAGMPGSDYDRGFRDGYFQCREDMKAATKCKLTTSR